MDGESGQISGLNNLFDGVVPSADSSDLELEPASFNSSFENIINPGSFESLTGNCD